MSSTQRPALCPALREASPYKQLELASRQGLLPSRPWVSVADDKRAYLAVPYQGLPGSPWQYSTGQITVRFVPDIS